MAQESTSFPQPIALSTTWDPEFIYQVFTAAALETRARGSHLVLGPVLDLAREPRWGRTEETYGEDPYLTSRIGVAAIMGFQGNGPAIDKPHVMATTKHFAVHGKVFSRGHDVGLVDGRAVSLKSHDGGYADAGRQVRILTVSFFRASPARFAGQVEHW